MAKDNFLTRLFKKRETEPGKVLICGHELTLKYSLYAATAFEKMTGKSALDLAQFQNLVQRSQLIYFSHSFRAY